MKCEVFDMKKPGLQHKLWLYFTAFSCSILVVLWLLQIIFFNAYYESMKIIEAENLGNEIAKTYTSGNVADISPQGEFMHGMIIRNISLDGSFAQRRTAASF